MSKRKRECDDKSECSICHDFLLKGKAILTLECDHEFHLACVGKWLAMKSSCPNCRQNNASVASLLTKEPTKKSSCYSFYEYLEMEEAPDLEELSDPIILHVPYEARRFARTNGAIYDEERRVWTWIYNTPLPQQLERYLHPPVRIYVRVPFREKDIARQMTGRWDSQKKCWYFIDTLPPEAVGKWPVVTP